MLLVSVEDLDFVFDVNCVARGRFVFRLCNLK